MQLAQDDYDQFKNSVARNLNPYCAQQENCLADKNGEDFT